MSLFTDSDHVTAAELRALDYEVADVAEVHKLTLEGVNSICRNAWEECGDRLLAQFQHYGSNPFFDANTLPWSNATGTTSASIALSQVVVSDELAEKNSPLENWMIYVALEGLYRAVANASQEDRYKKKQDSYAAEVARAWRTLARTGLPVVSQPLSAPGAIHGPGMAGAFRDTDVSAIASGTRDAQPVEVAITWWDSIRQVESGPSRVVGYQIDANSLLRVSRTGCLPPVAATHWNVYVSSLTGQPLTRQAQVAIATTAWTASGAIADTSTPLGTGQRAERRMAFTNFLQRA